MKYTVVGKNVEVTEAMKSVIQEKLKVLEKFFLVGEDVECRVLVRTYKVGQKIEVTIPTKVATLRAEVMDENIYNGVDAAVEKLAAQLRKAKAKMNRKNKEHLGTVLALDEIQEEKKDEKEILVKTKVIEVELMDLDQAITNMTMLGHDFYIYKDSENENIAVVYNRKNGGYGLIEVE
ncbi:MAG: ribosome-associated translation inhibitor RaiA [Bacilli bacterium]|jgi:putative sigma-54 modulation protein|nr:ribosome-associated translation inhibitor RaiA [Bacilli bacterium]